MRTLGAIRNIPWGVSLLLAIGLLLSVIAISSAAGEPGSNDAVHSRGGIDRSWLLLVVALLLVLIALAALLIRAIRRVLLYVRKAEQSSDQARCDAQRANTHLERVDEIATKIEKSCERIGRQIEDMGARRTSMDHQMPTETMVSGPGVESLGRRVEEVGEPRQVVSAEALAREFLQACDEKAFSLEDAARWFGARGSSIKVEDAEPSGGEAWRLLRIIEGPRAIVIPAVRRSMGGCPLARYFDLTGYNSFDPLRPGDVSEFALQVREAERNWKTERKGLINAR